jgi:hypothetical protein
MKKQSFTLFPLTPIYSFISYGSIVLHFHISDLCMLSEVYNHGVNHDLAVNEYILFERGNIEALHFICIKCTHFTMLQVSIKFHKPCQYYSKLNCIRLHDDALC